VGDWRIDSKHNFHIEAELVSDEKLVFKKIGNTYYKKKYTYDAESLRDAIKRGGFERWGTEDWSTVPDLMRVLGPHEEGFFGTKHLNGGALSNIYYRSICPDYLGRQFLAHDDDFTYLFSLRRHLLF